VPRSYIWVYNDKCDRIDLWEMLANGSRMLLGSIYYDPILGAPGKMWSWSRAAPLFSTNRAQASSRETAGRALLTDKGITPSNPSIIKDWNEAYNESGWADLNLVTPVAPTPILHWQFCCEESTLDLCDETRLTPAIGSDVVGLIHLAYPGYRWRSFPSGQDGTSSSYRSAAFSILLANNSLARPEDIPGWIPALATAGWTDPQSPTPTEKPTRKTRTPSVAAQQVYEALVKKPAVLVELLELLQRAKIATPWDGGNPYYQRWDQQDGSLLVNVWEFEGAFQVEIDRKQLSGGPCETLDEAKAKADKALQDQGWILLET
jgi:hypothetical protein